MEAFLLWLQVSFNLAIEMLFISGKQQAILRAGFPFQSRNRDAFHFRARLNPPALARRSPCFNLAIEMLFISGQISWLRQAVPIHVSISQSRCFSFQVIKTSENRGEKCLKFQSRNRDAFHFRHETLRGTCAALMRFQSRNRDAFHFRSHSPSRPHSPSLFQSRNRDAFHFRTGLPTVFFALGTIVSISQSRCFSFQVRNAYVTVRCIRVSIS